MRRKTNYKGVRLASDADDLELLKRWSDRACFREQIVKIKHFTEPSDALIVLCRHSLNPFKRRGEQKADEAEAFRLLAEWLRQVPELRQTRPDRRAFNGMLVAADRSRAAHPVEFADSRARRMARARPRRCGG